MTLPCPRCQALGCCCTSIKLRIALRDQQALFLIVYRRPPPVPVPRKRIRLHLINIQYLETIRNRWWLCPGNGETSNPYRKVFPRTTLSRCPRQHQRQCLPTNERLKGSESLSIMHSNRYCKRTRTWRDFRIYSDWAWT